MDVLIVDDDLDIQQVVADVLEDEGYTVRTAAHGAAALEQVAQQLPAVILLDMRMPVMDGWSFARAYRSRPGPHAPIVTMTAATDAKRWANEIGAAGVLAKPFEFDDLITVIERVAA